MTSYATRAPKGWKRSRYHISRTKVFHREIYVNICRGDIIGTKIAGIEVNSVMIHKIRSYSINYILSN